MPTMIDLRRGLSQSVYRRAFTEGASAYRRGADSDIPLDLDIDEEHNAYCAKVKIHHSHPKADAWMDGWVNADESADGFLKRKWDES